MVFSYYLTKYPYRLIWHGLRLLRRQPAVVVYCAEPLDLTVLAPIVKHLQPLPFVAKDARTARYLRKQGIDCRRWPCFPDAVITCRHAAHRFPSVRIVKIGFRHGAYHFKAFAKPRYYQAFDAYGVSSEEEVRLLQKRGVTCAHAVGFPKLDPAFDGTLSPEYLLPFRQQAGIQPERKTVLFTTTWDGSGLSAIEQWIDLLPELAQAYNVLVTLHPWTSRRFREKIQQMPGLFYIAGSETLPYLALADVMIGDYSSIIAEFCALDKPLVLFRLPATERSVPQVDQMLQEIGLGIENGNELPAAIRTSLEQPDTRRPARQKANELFFGPLDGRAGERAARLIETVLEARQIQYKTLL